MKLSHNSLTQGAYARNPADSSAAGAFIEAAKALRDGGGGGLAYARDFAKVIAQNSSTADESDA